jgi:hypothetical protein
MVARAWSGLTPAQRAAVDRALGAPHDASSPAVARTAQETLTPAPDLQPSADAFAGFYAQRLPVPAPQIRVFRTDTPIKVDSDGDGTADLEVAADALPVDAAGQWGSGPVAYCRVRIPPKTHNVPTQTRNLYLAHEVFHCFQFVLAPATWTTWAGWILEGTAAWASIPATDLPKAAGVANFYGPYLHTIDKPLFGRAYDAAGFWARVDEVGGAGSLWAKLPAILSTTTSADAFAAAGATAAPFVDTWASSSFRFTGAGPAWYQRAPYPVPNQEIPAISTIVLSGTTLGSNPYSTPHFTVATDPSMPLVNVVRLAGSLRAGTATKDLGLVDTGWYCYRNCACPQGETSSIPELQVLDQTWLALGLTGGAGKGGARVTYHALDEFCGPPSKALSVSGATTFNVVGPGYCVLPSPDVFQVQLPVSSGNTKVAQVVLEVKGFHGAGEYPTGPSVATVYDFRETSSSHLWETPSSGSITIANQGSPVGSGASGTVDSVTTGTSPEFGGITTTVTVSGSWSCVGGTPPPQ